MTVYTEPAAPQANAGYGCRRASAMSFTANLTAQAQNVLRGLAVSDARRPGGVWTPPAGRRADTAKGLAFVQYSGPLKWHD